MMTATLLVLGGLVALMVGGDVLVRGAVRLAEKAGVTPLLVGLVVVGFGTSMPELVTSIEASMMGSPAIAWGNIVGSNLANSLLILGAAAAISPMYWTRTHTLRDPAVAVAASVILLALAALGLGHWGIGVALVLGLFGYIAWCYRSEKAGKDIAAAENVVHDRATALEMTDANLHGKLDGWLVPILLTLAGLGLLILGGQALVTGAIDLARILGMSETLIGLTIVAIGTSLPELVTTVIAARKGESGIAFGNVIGSNLYNALGIGGATMMVAPQAIPYELLVPDLLLVVATAVFLLAWPSWRGRVGRQTGFILMALYAGYIVMAVLQG
ncbi:calcium/sodium antiporter [Altererythrobacter sp. MF3-039]|uniref:calcium/sodium antiporter n=1 Tax=Altererythrobacter sp. MF3-039 TaxID=3252901 RepID=UPI00390C8638